MEGFRLAKRPISDIIFMESGIFVINGFLFFVIFWIVGGFFYLGLDFFVLFCCLDFSWVWWFLDLLSYPFPFL